MTVDQSIGCIDGETARRKSSSTPSSGPSGEASSTVRWWLSSDGRSRSESEVRTPYRDRASGPPCKRPGTCTMANCHPSVFSFRRRRRGLSMPSMDRFLKRPIRGLWSVPTMRRLHPSVKYLVLSSALTIASASPSVGEYRLSALDVKRDPTPQTFHPFVQQCGWASSQAQCFWTSTYPNPDFDQSVRMQVARSGSKEVMPFSTSAAMEALVSWNRLSSTSSQNHVVSFFRRSRKGSSRGCVAWNMDT